ncbi:MAG: hypothetical protein MUE70_04630 [Desulfobacterales bacterium]|nr:hypothetical protein [Desulfobacterales bacterium]
MKPIHILSDSVRFHMDPIRLLEHVSLQIGYPKIPSDRNFYGKIQEIIKEGHQKVRIEFAYKETPILSWNDQSVVAGGIVIDSMRWAELVRQMDSPGRICVFIVTVGLAVDQWIQEVQGRSMFDAYIADAFASVWIEFAADRLSMEIEKQYARAGLECSRRLSPGYCDWRLGIGQNAIFKLVQTKDMGVSCLPSGLMVPLKTISAVMFTGKRVFCKTPCVFCNDRACRHRRETPPVKAP